MNHHLLPDCNIEGHDPIANQKKPMGQEHELVELLWRNGQVLLRSQTQRKQGQTSMQRNDGSCGNWSSLIQDEETISWIHHPFDDSLDKDYLCSNLYTDPIPPEGNSIPSSQQPEFPGIPMPPPKFQAPGSVQQSCGSPGVGGGGFGRIVNFSNFSLPGRKGSGSMGEGKECSIMTAGLSHCGSNQVVNEEAEGAADLSLFSSTRCLSSGPLNDSNVVRILSHGDARQTETLEPTVTSSSGAAAAAAASGSSLGGGRTYKQSTDTRSHKRKSRAAEESECQSQAAEHESAARNKTASQRSGSTRRSRAAEVHNLSERRRRDRINEKMRALQELIPHSNKSDKASMLDEAIEYLKSLQLQLQLMWMGNGVPPMMFPGVQQHYISRMGMGMGMGMGLCPTSIHNQMHLQRVQLLDQSIPAAPPPNHPPILQTPVLNPVNYQNQMQNANFSEQFAHYMGFHPPSQPMNAFSLGSQSQATASPAIAGVPPAAADGAPTTSKLGS